MNGALQAPLRSPASDGALATEDSFVPADHVGLLMDLETMVRRLEHELSCGSLLDAYLLAAGIGQIADDYLRAPPYHLKAAADYFAGPNGPATRVGAALVAAAAAGAHAVRERRASARTVLSWRHELAALIDALARWQVGAPWRDVRDARCPSAAAALAAGVQRLPVALRRAVVKLPACFQQFDQRPADVMRLVQKIADTAARDRPVLVVGIRTSGSYLAPLCEWCLRAIGYRDVRTLTVRPGYPLMREERRLLGAVVRDRGLALVIDDPPVTGSTFAATAARLERAGFPRSAIMLLLPVLGAPEVPSALRHYAAALLPTNEWAVTAGLEPEAVRRALGDLLGPQARVIGADPLPLPARESERRHMRRLFRVRTHSPAGEVAQQDVLVEGVGLGYLGAHRVIAQTLVDRFSANVIGLLDGLLYREWLPDERRVGPVAPEEEEAVAAAVTTYVFARRQALPAPEDLSLRMRGEVPAWEVASRILSSVFGRGWPLARVIVTDRASRHLLHVGRPSVVDGNTDLAHWFRPGGTATSLVKTEVGEDLFSNLCPPCFDAIFDLAGATARADATTLPRRMRRAFADLTGEAVDEERWLLYELVHLWGRERTQPHKAAELRRARARSVQRYFADVYLADVPPNTDGPLCALDIDGVLENEQFGCSSLTPSAALVLRALRLHGYRPVLASGRSLDEVSERCRAYGLAGGVAEYGAVTYETGGGRAAVQLADTALLALERLRCALGAIDGVCLDDDYRFTVRASVVECGQRRGLPDATVSRVMGIVRAAGIRVIAGEGQTDFVPAGVGKGEGLRALAGELGAAGERPFALAVGDAAPDRPFVDLAARACVPRHADLALRQAGFEVMKRPYQAGLADAVRGLLGHPPGGCAICRMPAPTEDRALLLALLSVRERGPLGIVARAVDLCRRVR